jgi:hypothetical protein|tara:strand:- start:3049 stop:3684 length:636 start_codon:yes stop_codon:yes gene_type:complete
MSLETDYTTVPGQVFACISIIGPECPQKSDKFGIKLRGAFGTRDEAANHAKRLQKEDPTFDIYVVEQYKWLLIPPDSSKIEDVHYTNEKLEEIMTGYKDNQSQATRMFNERKQGMMEDKVRYTPGDENSQFYTKPDEAPIPHPAEVLERLKKEKPDTPMEDLVSEADSIVAKEIEARKAKRLEEDAKSVADSTIGKIEESPEDGEPEVSSE